MTESLTALHDALTISSLDSRRLKPGESVERLPEVIKTKLRELKSDDVRKLRVFDRLRRELP
jgi:hypothetical protein